MITIGIDPHKSSHTAVALDPSGRILGELRVPASRATPERFLRWAKDWPERIWAVEGATGLGHLLTQQLVAREETVLDVPATLAARARLLGRGHGRKTDGIDARSVATVAQSQPDLRRVGPEGHSAVLRLLSDRRDELTQERRRVGRSGTSGSGIVSIGQGCAPGRGSAGEIAMSGNLRSRPRVQ